MERPSAISSCSILQPVQVPSEVRCSRQISPDEGHVMNVVRGAVGVTQVGRRGRQRSAPRVEVRPSGRQMQHDPADLGVDVRGLPPDCAFCARDLHRRLRPRCQPAVLGHCHDVVEARLGIEEVQALGRRKATVQAHEEARCRKRDPQQRQQPTHTPSAPRLAATLSGRSSAARRYCSTSSSRSQKPATAGSRSCHSAR